MPTSTTHQYLAADPQKRAAAILADAANASSPEGVVCAQILLLCNELSEFVPPPKHETEAFRFTYDFPEFPVTCVVYRSSYCALGAVYLDGADIMPLLSREVLGKIEDRMEAEAEARDRAAAEADLEQRELARAA